MKHYVSSKPETVPMFKNGLLDFFSRVHWSMPLVIYAPTSIGLVMVALLVYRVPPLMVSEVFIAGLFTWTFAEYGLHRFVFHYHSKSRIGKKIFWVMHGVHHDYPSDPLRLVMPPITSIPLACSFYAVFYFILGKTTALSFMSGFIAGYLIYDMCHYAIHHFPMKGSFWNKMKVYHMRHHYNDPEHGFGVTSTLWDGIFKTKFPEPKKPATMVGKRKSDSEGINQSFFVKKGDADNAVFKS